MYHPEGRSQVLIQESIDDVMSHLASGLNVCKVQNNSETAVTIEHCIDR